jgi:hypothetical protein
MFGFMQHRVEAREQHRSLHKHLRADQAGDSDYCVDPRLS